MPGTSPEFFTLLTCSIQILSATHSQEWCQVEHKSLSLERSKKGTFKPSMTISKLLWVFLQIPGIQCWKAKRVSKPTFKHFKAETKPLVSSSPTILSTSNPNLYPRTGQILFGKTRLQELHTSLCLPTVVFFLLIFPSLWLRIQMPTGHNYGTLFGERLCLGNWSFSDLSTPKSWLKQLHQGQQLQKFETNQTATENPRRESWTEGRGHHRKGDYGTGKYLLQTSLLILRRRTAMYPLEREGRLKISQLDLFQPSPPRGKVHFGQWKFFMLERCTASIMSNKYWTGYWIFLIYCT